MRQSHSVLFSDDARKLNGNVRQQGALGGTAADPCVSGYLRRCWFCLSDLQPRGDGLSLWDGGQRGRGRLHHLQGLLGDLNHLRVRFRLDHLDLLHHRWLPGTLNDQQVVARL